jgi:7-cyano-7-deazaguanine synthase
MKVVIIYSGGMDSTVTLYDAVNKYGNNNIKAITFNYGSKHNDAETLRAKKTCKSLDVNHVIINLESITEHLESNLLKNGGDIPEGHYAESNMKKTVVPFRNGIMLSVACGVAESWGAKKVIIGNHAGDHAVYPDCRGTFISAMNEAMAYGTYEGVNIESPFCSLSKADIAKHGNILNVNWSDTYSCYKGEDLHCGKCSTCFERREAFVLAKVTDPTEYVDKTPFSELANKYNKRLKNE